MRILTLLLILANVVVLALWSGAIPGTSERDPARLDRQIASERLQVRRAPAPESAPAAPERPAAERPDAPVEVPVAGAPAAAATPAPRTPDSVSADPAQRLGR